MRTVVLAVVLVADLGLLAAVIVWPWLLAVVVMLPVRHSLAEDTVNGRSVGEAWSRAAADIGMPDRIARWLRPRRRCRPASRTGKTHGK